MKDVFMPIVVSMLISSPALADRLADERAARQAELDAVCEAAREEKIKIERARHVEECVKTSLLADRDTCQRFYADYGEDAANQARLFYDLPECEKAHEYRNSYRSSDR